MTMKKTLSLVIVCILSACMLCACGGKKSEFSEFTWPNTPVAAQLPIPESNVGQVQLEKEDYLSVYVGYTSREEYDSYVDQCKAKGFTVDYSNADTYYSAYNSEGYHLYISYDNRNEMMDIMVTKSSSDDKSDSDNDSQVEDNSDDGGDSNSSEDASDEEDSNSDESSSGASLTGDEYESDDFLCRDTTDGKVEIVKYTGDDSMITIPSEIDDKKVVSIGESAFEGNTKVESFIIWAKIKEVGAKAFKGCTSLEDISLSSKVDVIRESTFEGCTSLKTAILWGKSKEFGKNSVKDCTSLSDIIIGSKCKLVGESAFENCSSMDSVIFWGGKEIGRRAFKGCTSLTDISLPSKVEKIGEEAFAGCSNLKKVYCWNHSVDVASDAFDDCPKLEEHP